MKPYNVFISYGQRDGKLARRVSDLLRRLNTRVFSDQNLVAGDQWAAQLRDRLEKADVVVAVLTPDGVASSWLLQELGAAWALNKPIISVVTKKDILTRVPIQLSEPQALVLGDLDTPEGRDKFVRDMESTLAANVTAG